MAMFFFEKILSCLIEPNAVFKKVSLAYNCIGCLCPALAIYTYRWRWESLKKQALVAGLCGAAGHAFPPPCFQLSACLLPNALFILREGYCAATVDVCRRSNKQGGVTLNLDPV